LSGARFAPRPPRASAAAYDLQTLVAVRDQLEDLRRRLRSPAQVLAALAGMLSLAIAAQRPEAEDHPPLRVLRREARGGRR
jgi:hypothetical protein